MGVEMLVICVSRVQERFSQWECRIVANTSAFQAEDAGSIPVIPSIKSEEFKVFRRR